MWAQTANKEITLQNFSHIVHPTLLSWQLPTLITGLCLAVYWLAVIVKAIIHTQKLGKPPNVLPKLSFHRLIRLIWTPAIIALIVEPIRFLRHNATSLHPLSWLPAPYWPYWLILSYIAAGIILLSTALTFLCWHKMGRSWRIGINPSEKTTLVLTGPYRLVLHPIYTLSILITLAAVITTPTICMMVAAMVHCGLLCHEAISEEHYLAKTHGQTYQDYKNKVGRFFPKIMSS